MPLTPGRPGQDTLAALVDRLSEAAVTYPDVGATNHGEAPDGYRLDRYATALGEGDAVFSRGREAIAGWHAHRAAGAVVVPTRPALVTGTVLVIMVPFGPLSMVAPCRVVYVTDEPDRFGFAYGTLPGHPERGEEAFHVVRDTEGAVRIEIVVFSRPASALVWLGLPVARALQKRVTRRYLEGIRSYVTDSSSP